MSHDNIGEADQIEAFAIDVVGRLISRCFRETRQGNYGDAFETIARIVDCVAGLSTMVIATRDENAEAE